MYKLVFAENFWRRYKQLTKKNPKLKGKIVKTFKLLSQDPKNPVLKSHKVATRRFGERWAAKVTGDIRIIWDYGKDKQLTILVLSLGSHSGKRKVYK